MWLGAGCTCGEPMRPPLDVGPRDTPPRIDTGPIDAPGTDAPMDDVPSDGPLGDAGIDLSSCHVQMPEDLMLVATDTTPRDRIVAVAAGSAEWAIAFSRAEMGIQNVYWALVPTSTDGTVASAVTTGFSIAEEPAVTRTTDGWLVAWMSNMPGNFEIFAQGFGADSRPLLTPTRLTTNSSRDDGPALVRVGSEVLAAWVESTATTREIRTRRLATSGDALAPATSVDVSPHTPSFPVLSTRLDGVALAFGSTDAVIVGLDGFGARTAAPVVLSAEGNVASSADLALDASGGAIVFDVRVDIRPEVRALLLDASGAALGPERVILLSPDAGNGASMTQFAGGYALAYRALEVTPPMIRVLFLGPNLEEAGRLDIASATTGSRTTIRASGDGRLLVAWADNDGTDTEIRAARIRCE